MRYENTDLGKLNVDSLVPGVESIGLLSQQARWTAFAVLVFGLTAAPTLADGSFQGLGDLSGGAYMSSAREISDDGSTVVGSSDSDTGAQAYMWRADVGMVGLGNLPGRTGDGRASHLTPDGRTIVGSTASGNSDCGSLNFNEAFLWTEETGMVGLGDIPGGCSGSNGVRISADGKKVLCASIGDRYEPAIWTVETGMVGMEINPNDGPYSGIAATPDFTVFAGTWSPGQSEMWRWSAADGWETFGDLPGGSVANYTVDITADGNTIVGRGNSNNGYEASRWTRSGGWEALGDLEGGVFDSFALSVVPDGALIVGYGTSASGEEAVMWDRAGRMRRVADVLACNDVIVPDGWVLQEANAITVNGNEVSICGTGRNPDGKTEAWLARYSVCIEAPCFQRLCDLDGGDFSSSAFGISADGLSVVGQSDSTDGPQAFCWRQLDWMFGLGDLAGGSFNSRAYAVSGDGSVVVGVSHSGNVTCDGRIDEAFRWTQQTGMVGLGDDPAGCFFSYAYGISSDGTTIVGGVTDANANTAAFWSSDSEQWTNLGLSTGPGNSSGVAAITPDLAVLVGDHRVENSGSYVAFRWTNGDDEEVLGDLSGGAEFAGATATSDDGEVIVGFGSSDKGAEGFCWTRATGMVGLDDLPDGDFASTANAVSPDGRLIVGFGTSEAGTEAVIWDAQRNLARLSETLTAAGVALPADWTLTSATGIAVNGDVVSICGNATNALGDSEAWVARHKLARQRLRGDMNCDGRVDFNDIDPFVTALISRNDYESQYPDCNWFNGDIDEDDTVNFNDIDGFVDCLINSGCP